MTAGRVSSARSTSFRAMGTDIELIGVGISEAELESGLITATNLAERWEQIFSRFRPNSELSRLNTTAGMPVTVSEDLFWMIEQAAVAHRRTEGRFDPTVLPALIGNGYDRDMDLVRTNGPGKLDTQLIAPSPGMAEVELDAENLTVRLPVAVRLDLGGIAKGAYVDRLALALMTWPGGCVNAGGDLRVWGNPPEGETWITGIENPRDQDNDVAVVALHDARVFAAATSAVNRRRWKSGDIEAHHLIDPRTGRSAVETMVSCTAFAGTAVDAEIATKSLYVAAAQHTPLNMIDAVASVMIDHNGNLFVLKGMGADALTIFPAESDRQSA